MKEVRKLDIWIAWGEEFHTEGIHLRWKHVWHVWGTAKRPICLEWNELRLEKQWVPDHVRAL